LIGTLEYMSPEQAELSALDSSALVASWVLLILFFGVISTTWSMMQLERERRRALRAANQAMMARDRVMVERNRAEEYRRIAEDKAMAAIAERKKSEAAAHAAEKSSKP
jgi:hypothetical protein